MTHTLFLAIIHDLVVHIRLNLALHITIQPTRLYLVLISSPMFNIRLAEVKLKAATQQPHIGAVSCTIHQVCVAHTEHVVTAVAAARLKGVVIQW